jgi:quercetin dioxygenase-like cupin family protein
LVAPAERELISLDSGVTWERLGQVPGAQVDFLLVTYQPGGTSSSNGELMRHSGSEYGYLLSGALTLRLGFDEHHLAPGDAVCFASSTPHGYRNVGAVPAVGVWVVLDQD